MGLAMDADLVARAALSAPSYTQRMRVDAQAPLWSPSLIRARMHLRARHTWRRLRRFGHGVDLSLSSSPLLSPREMSPPQNPGFQCKTGTAGLCLEAVEDSR